MNDNSEILKDKEILKAALDHMSEALGFLFETKNPLFQTLAFMVDSSIKLGTVIYHEGSILDASAHWEEYESELYEKKQRLRKIK